MLPKLKPLTVHDSKHVVVIGDYSLIRFQVSGFRFQVSGFKHLDVADCSLISDYCLLFVEFEVRVQNAFYIIFSSHHHHHFYLYPHIGTTLLQF